MSEQRLKAWLDSQAALASAPLAPPALAKGGSAPLAPPVELLVFEESCHSVAEAALAAGVTRTDFVKSICLMSTSGLIVAIVKGEDRASATRVGKLLGIERPRPATPDEMLELTGYPCGGTPPFGFAAQFLIDDRVLLTPVIYAGGGSPTALVKLPSADLARLNGGRVARIRS